MGSPKISDGIPQDSHWDSPKIPIGIPQDFRWDPPRFQLRSPKIPTGIPQDSQWDPGTATTHTRFISNTNTSQLLPKSDLVPSHP